MLIVFAGPIYGETHFTSSWQSGQRMQADPVGQNFRREPRVVNQAGKASGPSFLIPLRACQFSLIASLFGDDRQDDCGNPFELMAVRPREQMLDILIEVCLRDRGRCSDYHSPNIAQVLTCYDTPIYKSVLTSGENSVFRKTALKESMTCKAEMAK